MLAVALLIILLTPTTSLEEETNPIVTKCLTSLKFTVEKMTSSDVPKYCKSMRTDILQCLDKKMNYSTPGDLNSRTKMLNEIAGLNGSSSLLAHSKFFNIVCVQYNWIHWTDELCFRRMIDTCIVKNASSCNNIVCDLPNTNHSEKEDDLANHGQRIKMFPTLIILITYHLR